MLGDVHGHLKIMLWVLKEKLFNHKNIILERTKLEQDNSRNAYFFFINPKENQEHIDY